MMALNCTSTHLAVIDINGVLLFYRNSLTSESLNATPRPGERLSFERKDVWDMRWASDNEELFAMMVCFSFRCCIVVCMPVKKA